MQPKIQNEFSRLRDALNNITEVPGLELAPPSWEKMQRYLKADRKKRAKVKWRYAAAACLAIGLLLFWVPANKEKVKVTPYVLSGKPAGVSKASLAVKDSQETPLRVPSAKKAVVTIRMDRKMQATHIPAPVLADPKPLNALAVTIPPLPNIFSPAKVDVSIAIVKKKKLGVVHNNEIEGTHDPLNMASSAWPPRLYILNNSDPGEPSGSGYALIKIKSLN